MHYWDTSTLAKLYVAESDSPQFSAHHIATADYHGATGFVTTDVNMRKCAAAIGLNVFP